MRVGAGWKTARLGDVIDLFDSQRVPLNSRERQERQGQYPYYGAQGIIDHIDGYIFDGRFILVAEDGENLNSKKLPVALFATGKFWVNNHAHILQGRPGIADDTYLLACLNNANIRPFVTGAAQPKLSQANLCQIQIPLPPLSIQRRIASILSAYDDLIENSQRRIRILESMARALYREWFVKFRFPGHENHPMVDSALGKIPEGWERATVGSISSFISRGITPRYTEDSDSLVINQKCVREQRLNMEPARRQSKSIPDGKQIRYGDVLINSTGVGTLGRVAQVYEALPTCTVDTHVTIVRPETDTDIDYYGYALFSLEEHFERLGVGATGQTELGRVAISESELVLPPSELQRRFGAAVRGMRIAAIVLGRQIQNLRRTRDLLLPRLLSGQIDVKEA